MLSTGEGTKRNGFVPAESIGHPPPPGLTALSLIRSLLIEKLDKSGVVAKYPYVGFSIALAVRLIFPAGSDVATLQFPDPSEIVCANDTPPLDNTTVVLGVAVPVAVKFVPEMDWPSLGLVIVTVGTAPAFLGLRMASGATSPPSSTSIERLVITVFLNWNFLYCFIPINFKALQVQTQAIDVILYYFSYSPTLSLPHDT